MLTLYVLLVFTSNSQASERIVSIGGAITEILFELGLQENIIAVDTTSKYPESVKAMRNVGYMRALSAEPIIALNPDLILYQEDAGPYETIEHLKASGMNLVKISNTPSVQGVKNKIIEVADAVNKHDQGELIINEMERKLSVLRDHANDISHPARIMFVLSFDKGSALVAGKETGADGIISLANGINVIDHFSSYKPLGAESVVKLAPDYVLTTHRAIAGVGTVDDVLNLPVMRLTPAAMNKQLIVMDGLLLLGFGPRIALAASDLQNALHP